MMMEKETFSILSIIILDIFMFSSKDILKSKKYIKYLIMGIVFLSNCVYCAYFTYSNYPNEASIVKIDDIIFYCALTGYFIYLSNATIFYEKRDLETIYKRLFVFFGFWILGFLLISDLAKQHVVDGIKSITLAIIWLLFAYFAGIILY